MHTGIFLFSTKNHFQRAEQRLLFARFNYLFNSLQTNCVYFVVRITTFAAIFTDMPKQQCLLKYRMKSLVLSTATLKGIYDSSQPLVRPVLRSNNNK